jgi:hypothetical protein
MGLKDLPAMIDYIINFRNVTQIEAYVGNGLGNMQFFMANSLNNKYFEEKVNLFVALSP